MIPASSTLVLSKLTREDKTKVEEAGIIEADHSPDDTRLLDLGFVLTGELGHFTPSGRV